MQVWRSESRSVKRLAKSFSTAAARYRTRSDRATEEPGAGASNGSQSQAASALTLSVGSRTKRTAALGPCSHEAASGALAASRPAW